jgi:IMP cyclohydrolase
MALYNPENSPQQNLRLVGENPYVGRMLVQGFVGSQAVQAYMIQGRSEGSRNRVLTREDNVIATEVFDTSRSTGDPATTIYDAMRRRRGLHIVSNGTQTDVIMQYLRAGRSVQDALDTQKYEPDPSQTPRITGFVDLRARDGEPSFGLSRILKAGGRYDIRREFFTEKSREIDLVSGVGYALQTYAHHEDPLPAFTESPFKLPLVANAEEMISMLQANSDPENTVAVAAKVIDAAGRIQQLAAWSKHCGEGIY